MPAELNSLADLSRRSDGPTVDQIWSALLPIERQDALKFYLATDKANRMSLVAVAASLPALKAFRKQTILQMPDAKVIDIVAKANKLTPGILHDVLLALHLTGRTAMLESFLDLLGIPHAKGVINDSDGVGPALKGEKLSAAVTKLKEKYPLRDVQIYLLTLLAMDSESWGGVRAVTAS